MSTPQPDSAATRDSGNRSLFRRPVFWVVAAVLVVVIVVGVIVISSSNDTSTKATRETTGAPTSTTTSSPKVAQLGDAITLTSRSGQDIEVTVVQFLDRAPPPTTVIGPPAGQHLAAVQLKYVNRSRRAYEDSLANEITLIDSQGQSFSPGGKGTAAGAEFERGQLSLDPGEAELGFVSFLVNDSSTIAKVQVRLDSGYGDAGQWQVSTG